MPTARPIAGKSGRDGGTEIAPGIVARVAQGLRYVATGRAPNIPRASSGEAWFGPLEPLTPIAPPATAGRQFDFPAGYNLVTQPRPYEPVTFRELRGLADAYDLLRLVIETRKDQIARLDWTIRARGTDTDSSDPRVTQIRDFLAYPDREHGWDTWLRMLLEDLLVIDAPAIYPRLDNAGRLYALEPVDGATVKRVLDDWGRTPAPPAPAYQQVLKGLPAVDYAADELLYLPRNARTDRVYGFSPVEQIAMTVNIALRRQLHQLQYYTEGTVPEALIGVPETWTPDQIAQFQSYWDALLADDTAARRRARFVPATISKSFVQTKDAALKDEYDEWLARIVCYAFSVSPQWAVKAMNRATAETAAEQAADEGLAPLLMWTKGALDRILRQCFQAPDLEFAWLIERDRDTQAQAETDQVYLQSGVKTVNEVRAAQGLAPLAGGDAATIMAGNALVPLAQAANPPAPVAKYAADQPRDDHGRWTDGGGGGDASSDSAAETDQIEERHANQSAQVEVPEVPRPDLEAIAKDPNVAASIDKAWENSHPGTGSDSHEQGFYVVRQPDGTLSTIDFQGNATSGNSRIEVEKPAPPGTIAWFHTHPVPVGAQFPGTDKTAAGGPSVRDLDISDWLGIPGILKGSDGLHYFGPALPPAPGYTSDPSATRKPRAR